MRVDSKRLIVRPYLYSRSPRLKRGLGLLQVLNAEKNEILQRIRIRFFFQTSSLLKKIEDFGGKMLKVHAVANSRSVLSGYSRS